MPPGDRHVTTVRLSDDDYKWLRTQAYERGVSMQSIINEAIAQMRADEPRRGRRARPRGGQDGGR